MPLHTALDLLKPTIKDKAEKALKLMREDLELQALGVTGIAVVETLRDIATQMAYYSRGRMYSVADIQEMYKAAGLWKIDPSSALVKITWTMNSKHIDGKAIDIAPMKDKAIWWNAPPTVWKRIGEIGESCGLNWGGRWKNVDCPHFEIM